jgi:hypothetical protein
MNNISALNRTSILNLIKLLRHIHKSLEIIHIKDFNDTARHTTLVSPHQLPVEVTCLGKATQFKLHPQVTFLLALIPEQFGLVKRNQLLTSLWIHRPCLHQK